MISRLRPTLGFAELRAALSWNQHHQDVQRFEKAFAKLAGQHQSVAFPYGRTGLLAILQTLGLHGREIICPAYTCVVVPHAIVTSGNRPVFLDTYPQGMNMDLGLVDQAITKGTGAIIATSVFGQPADLDALDVIRSTHPEIPIIQDCAHSFFCEWNGRPVHKAGLCAVYGLNISKIMTSIFGGIVTTDDSDFASALRAQREQILSPATILKSIKRLLYLISVYPAFTPTIYGLINRMERSGLLDKFVKYYDPGIIDMPEDYLQAMTPLEARVGTIQCYRYPDIVAHRRKLAQIYFGELAGIPELRLPPRDTGATYSHFVIRTPAATYLRDYCLDRGIQLGNLIDYHIPDMAAYSDAVHIGVGNARQLPEQVINLPVHTGCSTYQAKRLARTIKNSLRNLASQQI
ncbi:MAG: DegT/DnrJ/EryC1/StrS family aminotransferase [Gammaproteobacteria bacterium]|nr:DegT/DnrJ/EryC1/StrS family aminotransferase [Gammaproteobacteria bacterium]